MATFAVGNPVTNVIVADDLATAELVAGQTCHEYTADNPAGIGWTVNEDGTFTPPVTA